MVKETFSKLGKSSLVAWEAGAKHTLLDGVAASHRPDNLHYSRGQKIGDVYAYAKIEGTKLTVYFSHHKEPPFAEKIIERTGENLDTSYHISTDGNNFVVFAKTTSNYIVRRVLSVNAYTQEVTETSNEDVLDSEGISEPYFFELNGNVFMIGDSRPICKYICVKTQSNSYTLPASYTSVAASSDYIIYSGYESRVEADGGTMYSTESCTSSLIDADPTNLSVQSCITSDDGSKNFISLKDVGNTYCYGLSVVDCDEDGVPTKIMPALLNATSQSAFTDEYDDESIATTQTLNSEYIVDGYRTPDYNTYFVRQNDEEGLWYWREQTEWVLANRSLTAFNLSFNANMAYIDNGQILFEYSKPIADKWEINTVESKAGSFELLKTFEINETTSSRNGKYTPIAGSPKEPLLSFGNGSNLYALLTHPSKSITEAKGIYDIQQKGDWTPYFNVSGMTYSKNEGWWRKTGDTIELGGIIVPDDLGTASSDDLQILGIPFPVSLTERDSYSTGVTLGKNHQQHYIYTEAAVSTTAITFFQKKQNQIDEGEEFIFQITYITGGVGEEKEVLVLTDGSVLVIESNKTLTI